jgi:transcriptional regulator with XRE-family HTH domain
LTTSYDTDFGKRLRRDREALNLTREDLASRAGVSYKTIERIEAGAGAPRRATVFVIEQALKEAA